MAKKHQNNKNPEFEREKLIEELYRPTRNHFPRRRIEIRSIDDLIEFDLGDLSRLRTHAQNYKYFLLGVNPFTKKIYTRALKTKTTSEVAREAEKILDESKIRFKNCFTDFGGEFFGAKFRELMKERGINHYTTRSKIKAAHSERYIGEYPAPCFKFFLAPAFKNLISQI